MKKVKPTEEEFFDTVDNWVYRLTGHGALHRCGFCKAREEASLQLGRALSCEAVCMAFKLCCGPYTRLDYCGRGDEEKREQLILGILEGIYKIGVRLGYLPNATEVTRK